MIFHNDSGIYFAFVELPNLSLYVKGRPFILVSGYVSGKLANTFPKEYLGYYFLKGHVRSENKSMSLGYS